MRSVIDRFATEVPVPGLISGDLFPLGAEATTPRRAQHRLLDFFSARQEFAELEQVSQALACNRRRPPIGLRHATSAFRASGTERSIGNGSV